MGNPFRLPGPKSLRCLLAMAERVLGLRFLHQTYQRCMAQHLDQAGFIDAALDRLGVRVQFTAQSHQHIPGKGPVVVVANHPTGMLDGLLLAKLLLAQRTDVKILANHLLQDIEILNDLFISVNVFKQDAAAKRMNFQGLRAAQRHLDAGGVLVVFPAGEVSSYHHSMRRVQDRPWNDAAAMLVMRYQATAVPVHIHGRNSVWFHLAGAIHPVLRTLLIPRQLLNKRKQVMRLHAGAPITPQELKRMACHATITQYLRLNCAMLAPQPAPLSSAFLPSPSHAELVPKLSTECLASEIAQLPSECCLINKGSYQVYACRSDRIPYVLQAIGRMREANFRLVGEGTGNAIDLDVYDQHYHHLFVWHSQDQNIVGAYRFACVDEVVADHGLQGLYTQTLFKYNHALLQQMGPCIEMGRSVIDVAYQKSMQPLLLLWQGICTYVRQHPHYTTLFGPISISQDYSERSRALMTLVLSTHHYDHGLSSCLRPRQPMHIPQSFVSRFGPHMLSAVASPQVLSKVIARMESGQGLPVLLRQYMQLNGRLIGFNIDPEFSNVLDGMIVVRIPQMPPHLLARYMGTQGAQFYREHHGVPSKTTVVTTKDDALVD
jgi:putative hemolysin